MMGAVCVCSSDGGNFFCCCCCFPIVRPQTFTVFLCPIGDGILLAGGNRRKPASSLMWCQTKETIISLMAGQLSLLPMSLLSEVKHLQRMGIRRKEKHLVEYRCYPTDVSDEWIGYDPEDRAVPQDFSEQDRTLLLPRLCVA